MDSIDAIIFEKSRDRFKTYFLNHETTADIAIMVGNIQIYKNLRKDITQKDVLPRVAARTADNISASFSLDMSHILILLGRNSVSFSPLSESIHSSEDFEAT